MQDNWLSFCFKVCILFIPKEENVKLNQTVCITYPHCQANLDEVHDPNWGVEELSKHSRKQLVVSAHKSLP